jgi:hypothetical protein
MAEVPTFKLVLVGDGGTGALFLSVFITACACVCVCVSFMHTYLCARFVRKFGTDHHDDVVGGLFLLHSGAKRNEELSRSTRGTTEASAWFLSFRDFVILTTRTNRYDVWETKR